MGLPGRLQRAPGAGGSAPYRYAIPATGGALVSVYRRDSPNRSDFDQK